MEQHRHEIKVIYNPKANRARNAQLASELHDLTSRLGGADWSSTEYPGHATELAIRAAQAGYQRVVSVGGDGTLHEILNGLMRVDADSRPALGIVPVGSGNDFARGIAATLAPVRAVEHVFDGSRGRPIDVGYVRLNEGPSQYWVNVLGVGFDAAVTLQSQHITRLHGKAMYFAAAVRTIIENYDAPALEVEIDGGAVPGTQHISQRVQMLTIGNGPREGGGFLTTPGSIVDDGLLDYAMFAPVSRPMMVRLIPEVMQGTHGRFKQVKIGTFRFLRLRSDRPLLVHSDGEMIALLPDAVHHLEIGIVPSALRLVS